jgi:drug/metabolite transporter (DMT)-like permease
MSSSRTLLLTTLAMLAFAGNSLLCRMALNSTTIDAGSFTLIRLLSGALMLGVIVRLRGGLAIAQAKPVSRWAAAIALVTYAACFSTAYVSLSAGTGALLLFGAVQITMIGYGQWRGERLQAVQILGLSIALAGLIGLLLPGVSTPPLLGTVLMLGAGVAWGIYSLLGRGVSNPTQATAGNFLRAVPLALVISLAGRSHIVWDGAGALYAVASGAIASGLGYALWYQALPGLKAAQAATVQLSVPIVAAIGATLWLQEPITLRSGLASVAVLGGIALVIRPPQKTVLSSVSQRQSKSRSTPRKR